MEKLNIEISKEDLKLHDTNLFLKLWDDVMEKYEIVPDNQELTEEITRQINISRGRNLCRICEGRAFIGKFNCWECSGRGYKY